MLLTQWVSLLLALVIIILSLMWRKQEHFHYVFPVLFLMGLHTAVFYGAYFLKKTNMLDIAFHTWSTVLRLHVEMSIIIIMLARHWQMKKVRKSEQEALKILKENGNGII